MKRKILLIVLPIICLLSLQTIAQTMPFFLQGTWKMVGEDVYEQWSVLTDKHMKGVAYAVDNGNVAVFEYLEISRQGDKVIYTAVVPGQNQGQAIDFEQAMNDTLFVFENVRHDFPQRIIYKKLSDNRIFVQLSGGDKEMAYEMLKYPERETGVEYNSTLAESLGADDYGMKNYMFVILKTGQVVIEDKDRVNEIFRGHLNNIGRLSEEGKLIVAGPLMKNDKSYRGIYIFNTASEEETETLLETDPAIKAGLLDAEIYSWYGSAALPVYLDTHKKIEGKRP